MIIQNFNSNLFNVSRFNDIQDGQQNVIDCYFDNELPFNIYASSDDGALYCLVRGTYPLTLDSTSSRILSTTFNNFFPLSFDSTSSKEIACEFDNIYPITIDATSRLPVYSFFDNIYPITLDATTGQVNIYQIDYNKDELVVSNTGALTFNGTQVNQEDSLGGYPSFSRIKSLTAYRNNANIENMNVVFVSGTNTEGEITVELLEQEEGYFIHYMDSDSTSFGPMVPVIYNDELKVHADDSNKFIIVEITEDLEIDNRETFSVRNTYNNVLGMSNFNLNGDTTQYRGIFIKNQHSANISDVKIWFDNGDSKVVTEYGLEYPINREIQIIPDIHTEPTDITWVNYSDSSSAVPLFNLNVAEFIGIWIKNTYDSTSVSPIEYVNMFIEYEKDSETVQKKLTGLTRGYDSYFDDKYNVHYNINDTIDSSGTVTTLVSEADLSGGYSIIDTSSVSIADGDLIYYDITKINRYGIEGLKSLNKYMVFDSSSGLGNKPFGPESGSVLYNNSGSILVQGVYNPVREEIKGIIDDIRATEWNFSAYITDSSSYIVENEITDMNSEFDSETEVFLKIIDDDDLLDETPLTFQLQSNRGSIESETTLILTGEVCKQAANVPTVNTLIGHNFGLAGKNLAAYSESLTIDSTGLVMTWGDGRVSLYKDDELVFKFFYKGDNSIFNTFYIPEGWSLLENQSFVATSTVTDKFTTYEYDEAENILYFLVNCRRFMKIDFDTNQISIKGDWNESAILPEVFSNESIFPRYNSTVFQIWNIENQLLMPYFILSNDGDVTCLGKLETNFDSFEIEAIV